MEKKTGLMHFVPQWKCVDDQPDNNRRLHYSRFALSPLLVDQAMTIGVALRRALLSEVEGISIISANIVGATHEYSTLDGVRESVDEILLNLKQIVLKEANEISRTSVPSSSFKEEEKDYRASIFAQGPGIVTAEHIKFPSSILAVDKDQPIATLLNETQLCIELFIQRGNAKQINQQKIIDTGFFIDATLTPVQKANFSIHSVRDPKGLQQLLLLEIWTNKTLTPAEALYQAHTSLLNLFQKVSPTNPSKNSVILDSTTSSLSSQPGSRGGSFEHKGSRKRADVKKVSLWNTSLVEKNNELPTKVPDRPIPAPDPEGSKFLSLESKKNFFQTKSNVPKEHAGSPVRLKSFTESDLQLDKNGNNALSTESLSIDELELSPRISNCLKRANIVTIADLSNCTEKDLLKIKNFGRKSVEQVNLGLRKRFNIELLPNK
jgi:DNA-directed RNA polymerase alpha subunit